jgi:hypothetical protein
VPLRLFRILDKRFYHAPVASFDLHRLCIGTLGLCPDYSPSQIIRVLDRAAKWLIECGYLQDYRYQGKGRNCEVSFRKRSTAISRGKELRRLAPRKAIEPASPIVIEDSLKAWLTSRADEELERLESEALQQLFGSELERTIIAEERAAGVPVRNARRIRQEYVRRFYDQHPKEGNQAA